MQAACLVERPVELPSKFRPLAVQALAEHNNVDRRVNAGLVEQPQILSRVIREQPLHIRRRFERFEQRPVRDVGDDGVYFAFDNAPSATASLGNR